MLVSSDCEVAQVEREGAKGEETRKGDRARGGGGQTDIYAYASAEEEEVCEPREVRREGREREGGKGGRD